MATSSSLAKGADVLTIEDGAGEDTGHIQAIGEGGIRTELDHQIARLAQVDAGTKRSQPFDLDDSPGAAVLNDVFADFPDGPVRSRSGF